MQQSRVIDTVERLIEKHAFLDKAAKQNTNKFSFGYKSNRRDKPLESAEIVDTRAVRLIQLYFVLQTSLHTTQRVQRHQYAVAVCAPSA